MSAQPAIELGADPAVSIAVAAAYLETTEDRLYALVRAAEVEPAGRVRLVSRGKPRYTFKLSTLIALYEAVEPFRGKP